MYKCQDCNLKMCNYHKSIKMSIFQHQNVNNIKISLKPNHFCDRDEEEQYKN